MLEFRNLPKTTRKKCLKCEKGFRSLGKHNRLCFSCNRENNNQYFTDLVNPQFSYK